MLTEQIRNGNCHLLDREHSELVDFVFTCIYMIFNLILVGIWYTVMFTNIHLQHHTKLKVVNKTYILHCFHLYKE